MCHTPVGLAGLPEFTSLKSAAHRLLGALQLHQRLSNTTGVIDGFVGAALLRFVSWYVEQEPDAGKDTDNTDSNR